MHADPDSHSSDPYRLPWPERRRLALRFSLIGGVLLLVPALAYLVVLLNVSPDASDLKEAEAVRPSVLMSADGEVLTTFGRAQQQHVTLAEISPHVIKALIATEDRRFHDHHGVDFRRTVGAMFHTATGNLQGGSTITQQLARNLFPEEIGRSRSLHRKLKELITALRIEQHYTKDQILTIYLNSAPFLYNAVGIEMAARTYLDKPAAELSALESAMLVGMLKGPHYYNPVLFPERALKRRNVVLAQMLKLQALPETEYRTLIAQPLRVSLTRQAENLGSAPHFAAHARKWLTEWAETHDQDLYADGLVIETTLDARLQRAAEQAVQKQAASLQHVADAEWSLPSLAATSGGLESYAQRGGKAQPFAHFWKQHEELLVSALRDTPAFRKAVEGGATDTQALQQLMADTALVARLKAQKTRLEAGFVAMDPATGEVKAWVGSRDFNLDQYDHVAQAERQPGSTFKPFVYGAALESGMRPERAYVDRAVEIRQGGNTVWRPTDMSGPSGNTMSLRDGLVYSKNTITAQVMQDVGIARVVALAKAAGVDQSRLDPVPSLALGTSPVTLLEMVNGYATIAQEGQHHAPLFVKRIRDRHGNVLAEFGSPTRRAMSADSAVQLMDMMRGVVSQGTGTMVKTRFGIVADIAGKTGTTQNNTDGWFILMHPQLVAGAWVGFNDSRVTMRSNYWGQGGHNAILLVGDFFRDSLKGGLIDPKARFAPPRQTPPVVMANWSAVSSPQEGAALVRLEIEGNAQGDEDQPPMTAEELDRVVRTLDRSGMSSAPSR
ncbi:MAG: transglycosylase domain-containing protein [Cytophagales bacterium]|nr:transglycosylase domain-containing protein [Rhizobacter sp.]